MMKPEALAIAINKLASGLAEARQIMSERALLVLLSDATGMSQNTVRKVLNGIHVMPSRYLTEYGRGIRVREEDDEDAI